MGWDASTISSVVALVVACFALLIAVAQVIQQYLVTGQLIRLCDSVVFGPLPGSGHRVWEPSQLRFRVVYSIPQYSLDAMLWPAAPPHVKSYASGQRGFEISLDELQPMHLLQIPSRQARRGKEMLNRQNLATRKVGEASWVSFLRVVEGQCGDSILFQRVEYDADRCPPDLVTAPMQVSMRDVIVMSLMAGMQVTDCSFRHRSISMQGEVGTITSSNHPVLGPILHFTPREVENISRHAFDANPYILHQFIRARWLCRTWDVCMVAGKYYNAVVRRTARRLDERWIKDQKAFSSFEVSSASPKKRNLRKKGKRPEKDVNGNLNVDHTNQNSTHTLHAEPGSISTKSKISSDVIQRGPRDGPWIITMPMEMPDQFAEKTSQDAQKLSHQSRPTSGSTSNPPRSHVTPAEEEAEAADVKRGAKVEDDLEEAIGTNHPVEGTSSIDLPTSNSEMADRIQIAKDRQEARRRKLEEVERDKSLVDESLKRGAITSPYLPQPGVLLLTQFPHDQGKDQDVPQATPEEEAARKREEEREGLRRTRDEERELRNQARDRAVALTKVNIFWLSQMDVFHGFWATPWQSSSDITLHSSLVGAVTVVLESLLGFLDDKSLIYTDLDSRTLDSFQGTTNWLLNGNCTWPSYAINARDGVIAGGVSWSGVRIPAFKNTVMPPLELLHYYEWQVVANVRDQIQYSEEMNVELMRLDSWLSYVGRTHQIAYGPNKLHKQTPALLSLLVSEFELDFQNMDLSASEGGLQDIQGLSANVMDFLTDEGLTEPEQLFMLVALLRTVKVGQAILAGADTAPLHDILLKDVQAHLV